MVIAILREAREEVARADAKASALLTGAGIVASVTVGAMLAGDWSPEQLAASWAAAWWVGGALGALGIGCLGLAVVPRLTNTVSDRPALTYFNDVALLKTTKAVRDAIERIDPRERDVSQMIALSIIARRKYVWIRRSMAVLTVAVALMVTAGIAGR